MKMPELGMGLYQAQRLDQRLELRQAIMPGDLGVDPFRTDGENVQVSQYEILKRLVKLIEDGEFFDQDHFRLEINRSVFSHPLEARLGNFGRDIHQLVTQYKSDDQMAKRIVSAIGSQREEDKDIPGQIASSWNKVFKSNYFRGEPKQKRVLSLVEFLNQNDADINSALDVVSRATQTGNQPALVDVSLGKIRSYGETDKRLIPFSQSVLSPVLRALGIKKEKLSEDEANALYQKVVEQLYMLDRDLRVGRGTDRIVDSISKKGFKATLESRLSIPLQTAIDSLSPNDLTYQKLLDLTSDPEFEQGREMQRKLYRGLSALDELDNGNKILTHTVANASNAKSLAGILAAVNLIHSDREFSYPFGLQEESEILRNLKLQLVDKSIKRLNLDDATLEKYLSRLEGDERFERISRVVTTLAGYSHYQNPEQIGLLGEIAQAEVNGQFPEWRYSHNLALEQLAVLDDKTTAWRKNSTVRRGVGELDALNSHIDAVKSLVPKTYETYVEHYGERVDKDTLENLRERIRENEGKLRSGVSKKERRELGYQTAQLREQAEYLELFSGIKDLNVDNYEQALGKADRLAKKKSKNPLYESARWIRETLDQPVYRDARKVNVTETDDLEYTLRMGEIPVPHCQNWKTDSTLNGSLLSFVADANKKLYHISNGNNRPVSMSMVKLVDWDRTPTLLVENTYANEWCNDYGVALLGSLADKALSMYEETGKEVRIAAPVYSGHEGHDTNIQVLPAMERFSEKYRVELDRGHMQLNPARSKNTSEYWDCGPGKVPSGERVSFDVAYITFGGEND
jgi:hypothetical protein